MKCNAGRWFDGDLVHCDYEHGHGGVCSWHGRGMADGALLLECERRGLVDRSLLLRVATDAELRAECERRFPQGFGVVHEVTLRERENANATIIELRDLAAEWRRRAEAAEAQIATFEPVSSYDYSALLKLLEAPPPPAPKLVEAMTRFRESSPGIAAKPMSDEHYVDPWDLLADDA